LQYSYDGFIFIRIEVFNPARVVRSFGSISEIDIVLAEIAIGFAMPFTPFRK